MRKQLSTMLKCQFFGICFLMAETVFSQSVAPETNRKDSLDRYGAIGLRPGVFSNLTQQNRFTMPILGIFIDYSFGKFRHTIELDFLTRKPKKIFKHTYSPCFTYNFAVKAANWKKMDVHPGVFFNCRKDVMTVKQYFFPNDTTLSYATSGFHTVFSLGPSVELSRKVFLPGKKSFLTLGARILYSFDILAFGTTFYEDPNAKSLDPWQRIRPKDRFQRDAFVATVKIGWGKLAGERSDGKDFELDMAE